MSGSTGYKPSGFLTNFENSISLIDMLSTVSVQTSVGQKQQGGNTAMTNARYFNLGNLLIQFSDGVSTNNRANGADYTQYYPVTFSATPYTVLISQTNSNSNSGYATVISAASSSFEFRIGGMDGNITWMAIGPR